MSEQNNTAPEGTDKTFTQDDVNRIVQDRLAAEKTKAAAIIAEREKELAHKEFMLDARSQLEKAGLPAGILEGMNTSSPEAFKRAIELLEPHMGKPKILPVITKLSEGGGSERNPIRDAMGLNRKD